MLSFRRLYLEGDVAPHAIFWRPIRYFANYVQNDVDNLDEYQVVSFQIGNQFQFDLRSYEGHPASTVSLYTRLDEPEHIVPQIVNRAIEGLKVPTRAVAWKRGQIFQPGELSRDPLDRLREPEARLLALRIAARHRDNYASTRQLLNEVPNLYPLSQIDLEDSKTRVNEQRWQQIVRNVISHKDSPLSPFQLGYAIREGDGLSVTEEGLRLLESIGYAHT